MDFTTGNDILQLATFKLGAVEFGVDILKVQEIIRILDITKVPNAPRFVEGVINLRGAVIPIIDLRRRFGLPPAPSTKDTRIIVVEITGTTVGLIVDSVSEVMRLPSNTVEPPPPVVAGIESDHIAGVGKVGENLLVLLDMDKLLSDREHDVLGAIS